MAELGALRTAKQALDEGLITQQDFEVVKVAFLRAQQIKAGLDAGFIRRDDYDRAVHAYLHAMDFQVMATVPSVAGTPSAPTPRVSAGLGAGGAAAGGAAAAATTAAASAAAAAPRPAAPPPPPPAAAPPPPPPPVAPPRPAAAPSNGHQHLPRHSSASTASADGGGGGCELPADLPDYCRGATEGKKSMSGIAVDPSCVNLFMHLKTRSAFKWLIFKVDGSGRNVVPEQIGRHGSTYNEFVCALPESECRYAVYDYEYRSRERGTFKKLVFLLWAPDTAGIKPKMMYASTKDFFKGFMDGVGAELQANEPSELSEEEMKQRVVDSMTRK